MKIKSLVVRMLDVVYEEHFNRDTAVEKHSVALVCNCTECTVCNCTVCNCLRSANDQKNDFDRSPQPT